MNFFESPIYELEARLEKLKQDKYSISNEELRQYFPVDTVVAGLFDLAERLYGIRLQRQEDIRTWHEDVRYYSVQNEGSALIGGFYTDLFARSGKRSGAWVDECVVRKNLNSGASYSFVNPSFHSLMSLTEQGAWGREGTTPSCECWAIPKRA